VSRLFFALPGDERLAREVASGCGGEVGEINFRRYPEGDAYFRLEPVPAGRPVVLVARLINPDPKTTSLLFMSRTARELGATSVGLVAPYMPYMRQDRRFRPGEPVSARLYADLLSAAFDWVVTVEPHLHRIPRLSQIFAVPAEAVSAAPLLAEWIRSHVARPLVVGPDEESAQWASRVAATVGAPWATMVKRRLGDREVEIAPPDLSRHAGRTAVLVDDMVSTGRTVALAAEALRRQGFEVSVCAAAHDLTGAESRRFLTGAGLQLVSTDSVRRKRGALPIAGALAEAVRRLSDGA
jgi:ribose-phosphate pyrophosphokinase